MINWLFFLTGIDLERSGASINTAGVTLCVKKLFTRIHVKIEKSHSNDFSSTSINVMGHAASRVLLYFRTNSL